MAGKRAKNALGWVRKVHEWSAAARYAADHSSYAVELSKLIDLYVRNTGAVPSTQHLRAYVMTAIMLEQAKLITTTTTL